MSWIGFDQFWLHYAGVPEERAIYWISIMMATAGSWAFFALLFIAAPYGKHGMHASSVWGFKLNGRLAWVLQESPSFIVPALFWLNNPTSDLPLGNRLLLALFLAHYFNRSFIYPLRMNKPSGTPLTVFLMAFSFCCINGYIQGRTLTKPTVNIEAHSFQFVLGVIVFFTGIVINWHSDAILRALRTPANPDYREGSRYYIPKGGMFTYVSGANFFGEILEWLGFALAANTTAAYSFAWFTFCNIAPRGAQHHDWYLQKFREAYPRDRKAVIPFIW